MNYERLFSPIKVNGMTLKNRIMFPPMAMHMDHCSGEFSQETIGIFERFARGGAAMLVTNTMFPLLVEHRPTLADMAIHQRPILVAPDRIDMRKQLSRVAWVPTEPTPALNSKMYNFVEGVHVNGSKICAAMSSNPMGWALKNYDPDDDRYQGFGLFNKITVGEIEATIEEYAITCCELAGMGFDAIEMNFSYFPDYFAHPAFNKRTDKYGPETLETRLQYHKELIQATRREVGPNFPLMSIIDVDHYGAKGWSTTAETQEICKKFQEWGIDAVRARGGGSVMVHYDIAPMYIPHGVNIPLSAALKDVLTIPVAVSTRMDDPEMAEMVLAEGKADIVSIGRGLIADPDLPNKWAAGRPDRVRKCIACNVGCFGNLTMLPRRPSRCTVNPYFAHESRLPDKLGPAQQSRKVVIVGAGPAGMSAALTAAQRGHNVVLLEKAAALGGGGQFQLATIAPYKDTINRIPDYYGKEFAELPNLSVKLGVTADADMVMGEKPDAVIVATGGKPLGCPIPGSDGARVVDYAQALSRGKSLGEHVVVVGGGHIGCETAHTLLALGKKVTILEMLYRIADQVEIATRNCIIKELTDGGAEMIPGATVNSISDAGVAYTKDGVETVCPADNVVLATGSAPVDDLASALRGSVVDLRVVGDAKEPRQVIHAVSEGFYAAYHL